MINVKIRILRGLLEEAINNIDAGNSNHTEEELNEIIDDLTKLNRGIKIRLYQDWFPNLTEEQLDEKVIYSAINFWFKDEDAGTGKVWNYFKEI